MSKKQVIGAILGIVLGLGVAIMTPPEGLSVKAMWALGIFVWGVTYLIFEVAPDYVVTIAMCSMWPLFKTVPFITAFSFFADPTWWLMVGALGIGVAASKSGLLRRIALLVMRIAPATFKGQTLALMGAGTLIAPLIPSITAKAAICSPLSVGISDAMGYKRKTQGPAGLFAAMMVGFVCTGPSFLSASFLCYMIKSFLPKDVAAQFHWMQWFLAMIPWTIVLLVLSYFAIQILYKPEEKDTLPAGYAADQLAKMGPMSRIEKITLAVLLIGLLLWMTEMLHGIPAVLIALFGLVALLYGKVYDRPDFKSGIPWDAVVFIGTIVGISYVFPYLKIDKWMGVVLGPVLTPLVSNPYLFVGGLAVAIYLIRFVLVSQVATLTIFPVMLTPFAMQAGVNPWIVGIIVFASMNVWNVFYQNTTYLAAFYAAQGAVEHKHMVKLSVAYMIISLLGFLISVPYWQMMGLIR